MIYYIKKILNNKCYIFKLTELYEEKLYLLNEIIDIDDNRHTILYIDDIYIVGNKYLFENEKIFITYEAALHHEFMNLEQWKYYKNGYSGIYKHYNELYETIDYEFFHVNGKINDTYTDNKIIYKYIDGKLIDKKVYYDHKHELLKKHVFINNDNLYETKNFNKNNKLIEHNIEIKENVFSSIIFTNSYSYYEINYIIKNNTPQLFGSYREYKFNSKDKTNLLYIDCLYNELSELDGFYKEINDKYKIYCYFSNGKLTGLFELYTLDDNLIIECNYDNNKINYYCEYYTNKKQKLKYCVIDNNIAKFIEYYESGNLRREYYKTLPNNNKSYFTKTYKEYYENNKIYRECYFEVNKYFKLNIYDENSNILDKKIKKVIKNNKIKYYSFKNNYQKNEYFKLKIYTPTIFTNKKNNYGSYNYIINTINNGMKNDNKRILSSDLPGFSSYNILRIMSGLGGLGYI